MNLEQNRKLIYLPLDLPIFEADPDVIRKNSVMHPGARYSLRTWKYLTLRTVPGQDGLLLQFDLEQDWQWTPIAREYFQKLIGQCAALPLQITYAVVLSTFQDASTHKDYIPGTELPDFIRACEPAYYRVHLYGNKVGSIYFHREMGLTLPLGHPEALAAEVPSETNSYLLSCDEAAHGSVFQGERMIALICGKPDADRHAKLIRRSAVKYAKYALFVDHLR